MKTIISRKSVSVKSVDAKKFTFPEKNVKISVGIDVGKGKHYACLYVQNKETDEKWTERPWIVTPPEVGIFAGKLAEINKFHKIRVGMESSGTYGDPLRQALTLAGLEVVQIRSKYVHDQKECDGAPSKHDAKDSAIIAMAVADGRGEAWGLPVENDEKSRLKYLLKEIKYKNIEFQQRVGRLEAEFGCYTPPQSKFSFPAQAIESFL